jgi:hypothetical protein
MTRWIYTVSKSRMMIYVAVVEEKRRPVASKFNGSEEVAKRAWRRSIHFWLLKWLFVRAGWGETAFA